LRGAGQDQSRNLPRSAYEQVHEILQQTVGDLSPELLNRRPAPDANPIGWLADKAGARSAAGDRGGAGIPDRSTSVIEGPAEVEGLSQQKRTLVSAAIAAKSRRP
jgi:hypothetical protein